MDLSNKIIQLRKKYGFTQKDLAEKCNVTTQAISKWELGTSVPATDSLITLSNIFNISLDTLLREDRSIEVKIKNSTCHKIMKNEHKGYYQGLLIKESISDETILDLLNINKVELWVTDSYPKYWTALFFTSDDENLPEKFSKVMISDEKYGGNWYVDFKHENTKYIIFKDHIFFYTIGNIEEKNRVKEECLKLGISNIDEIGE